jgi:hypothetical protein
MTIDRNDLNQVRSAARDLSIAARDLQNLLRKLAELEFQQRQAALTQEFSEKENA